jgi:hypothetical protein
MPGNDDHWSYPMTFSPLISGTVPHYNKFSSRGGTPIVRLIQHHHAATSNAGLARLTDPNAQASATYVIMSDGSILGQVPEEYRPWTSGSFEVDVNSVTIEVQNSGGQVNGNDSDPSSWPISAAAYNSIIALLADVAKRYGWGGIAASNYRGHREFGSTACPGGYLWNLMGNTRAAAQSLFSGGTITTQGTTNTEGFLMALSDEEQRQILAAANRIMYTVDQPLDKVLTTAHIPAIAGAVVHHDFAWFGFDGNQPKDGRTTTTLALTAGYADSTTIGLHGAIAGLKELVSQLSVKQGVTIDYKAVAKAVNDDQAARMAE